jgi:hypothetical protein
MAADTLVAVAREFSPRVEAHGTLVTFDINGLDRLLGDAWAIGRELRRAAADRGLAVHVAVAATRSAAMLLACGRSGLTVARPGEEQRLLADLPLSVLELSPSIARLATVPPRSIQRDPRDPLPTIHCPLASVLRRWGLRTLGELAALPPEALSERLGQDGVRWQHLARGEDAGPLVPDLPEKRYEASLDLEWPVEGLEPLSFVFARLFEPLCAELAHDDRAAAVLHVTFTLVTREIDTRTLQLPAPMHDPRVLRTLVLLNLEGHPVAAGIDRIVVTADPAPSRIVQGLLLGRALPVPERLAPLVARLGALMGETRVGAAALVESHRPGAFQMTPFGVQEPGTRGRCESHRGSCPGGGHLPLRPGMSLDPVARLDARATARDRFAPGLADDSRLLSDQPQRQTAATRPPARGAHPVPGARLLVPDALPTTHCPLSTVLRRFRIPIPARVRIEDGVPAHVTTDRTGFVEGRVEQAAGPWRTSGEWWQLSDARLQLRQDGGPVQVGWNRDEWDVALGDGGIYRLYRDRSRNRWFVDGIVD